MRKSSNIRKLIPVPGTERRRKKRLANTPTLKLMAAKNSHHLPCAYFDVKPFKEAVFDLMNGGRRIYKVFRFLVRVTNLRLDPSMTRVMHVKGPHSLWVMPEIKEENLIKVIKERKGDRRCQ